MDLLNGKIKPLYFKYLSAAFGSALISSIYGMVDMAMVGQYQGPDGTGGADSLGGAGTGHQRHFDPAAAGADQPGFPVAGHAGHGAADGALYGGGHSVLYKSAVKWLYRSIYKACMRSHTGLVR